MTRLHFILLFTLTVNFVNAQVDLEDFRLGGTARVISDECIRLTPEIPFVGGSAWYKEAIDLTQPFTMEIDLVLGEIDELGADGIVFVFSNYPATGFRGEGMGFAGLAPSMGIEFDTYQNFHLNDPAEDHIAVMFNGQSVHWDDAFTPVKLTNIEDGNRHALTIIWDPGTPVLQVFLDEQLYVNLKVDLVNSIFAESPLVYWGATAATGRKINFQDICIRKLIFASR